MINAENSAISSAMLRALAPTTPASWWMVVVACIQFTFWLRYYRFWLNLRVLTLPKRTLRHPSYVVIHSNRSPHLHFFLFHPRVSPSPYLSHAVVCLYSRSDACVGPSSCMTFPSRYCLESGIASTATSAARHEALLQLLSPSITFGSWFIVMASVGARAMPSIYLPFHKMADSAKRVKCEIMAWLWRQRRRQETGKLIFNYAHVTTYILCVHSVCGVRTFNVSPIICRRSPYARAASIYIQSSVQWLRLPSRRFTDKSSFLFACLEWHTFSPIRTTASISKHVLRKTHTRDHTVEIASVRTTLPLTHAKRAHKNPYVFIAFGG